MRTSSCKAKGRREQQYVRDRLRNKFTPMLQDDDIKSTTMGESGVDIQLSPAAKLLIPFDIETKNVETASVWAWMKQAKANTKHGRKPLVVFTRNHENDHYAMLRFEDLLELLK